MRIYNPLNPAELIHALAGLDGRPGQGGPRVERPHPPLPVEPRLTRSLGFGFRHGEKVARVDPERAVGQLVFRRRQRQRPKREPVPRQHRGCCRKLGQGRHRAGHSGGHAGGHGRSRRGRLAGPVGRRRHGRVAGQGRKRLGGKRHVDRQQALARRRQAALAVGQVRHALVVGEHQAARVVAHFNVRRQRHPRRIALEGQPRHQRLVHEDGLPPVDPVEPELGAQTAPFGRGERERGFESRTGFVSQHRIDTRPTHEHRYRGHTVGQSDGDRQIDHVAVGTG